MLLFSPPLFRGGTRGAKAPLPTSVVHVLFHLIHQRQLLPSVNRQAAGEKEGDESGLIDKLNY